MKPSLYIPGRKLQNAASLVLSTTLAGPVFLTGAPPAQGQLAGASSLAPPAESWQVVERGPDFAVYQRRLAVPQADGMVAWRTNGQFTLLENGLHYWDRQAGVWQPSRDLIESFPDGAIARYGPVRAIFSHDLNAESVFDLETPAGARMRGGLRALEWQDEVTGKRQLLAGVKASAPFELVPPNRLVARDAFAGVLADVVLEWRHHRFSQSVVLRELPWPPAGFEPAATRLVVVTEFLEAPEPEIQRVTVPAEAGRAAEEDHVALHFDGASILMGHAFVAGAEGELTLGVRGAERTRRPSRCARCGGRTGPAGRCWRNRCGGRHWPGWRRTCRARRGRRRRKSATGAARGRSGGARAGRSRWPRPRTGPAGWWWILRPSPTTASPPPLPWAKPTTSEPTTTTAVR